MLLWIFVAILIIGIICLIAYRNTNVDDWCDILGTVLTIISMKMIFTITTTILAGKN